MFYTKLLNINTIKAILTACFLFAASISYANSFKIVLDAGHGGKDSGALGKKLGTKEKDINLSVTLMLGKMLSEVEGIEVLYTRDKDVFIPLDDRPAFANKKNANLFISIHSNATENRSINGVETYTLGESRNDVSVRENKAAELEENFKDKYDFDGSDENFILSDMMLDAGSGGEMSIRFAQMVQGRFRAITDRMDRDVRQANFWVLKKILMPGALVEIGYLSNLLEEDYLAKKENQMTIAKSIFEAVMQYKEELMRKSQPMNETAEDKAETTTKADDVFYRIQLFSSNKQFSPNATIFKHCTPAYEVKEGAMYKYVYGKEQSYADALMLRQKVRMEFPDAFIVVYKNGVKLTGKEAAQYLK